MADRYTEKEVSMFDRFTDRARRVVVLAQEEARLHNHEAIGTEHLLLGMLNEGEGIAALALNDLGASLEATRDAVLALAPAGDEIPEGHLPFTPRAKKVLDLSLREALQLGHNYIGTEHLLLGLCRENEGTAVAAMNEIADTSQIRQAVIRRLMPQGKETPAKPAGERNIFVWVGAGQEIETPEGMTFRSVVATRIVPEALTNQYADETLLWFSADAPVAEPPRIYVATAS